MNNIDIAILTKVNELSERHGLCPMDFVATIRDSDSGSTVLAYETAPDSVKDPSNRFGKMLDDIGVAADGTLAGDFEDIYSALTSALAKAPNHRIRR